MKKYKFCLKNNDEAISSIDAESKYVATETFAKIKRLSVEDFIKIYVVLPVK
jgi:hypothetical protein